MELHFFERNKVHDLHLKFIVQSKLKTCSFLKKIVVAGCNMLLDFFVRCKILSGNTM